MPPCHLGEQITAARKDDTSDQSCGTTAGDVERQKIRAQTAQRKRRQNSGIVRGGQIKSKNDRQRDKEINGVECVQQQAGALRVIEHRRHIRIVTVHQRSAQPPQIPQILPGIKSVAGNGSGHIQSQRPCHQNRQREVKNQRNEETSQMSNLPTHGKDVICSMRLCGMRMDDTAVAVFAHKVQNFQDDLAAKTHRRDAERAENFKNEMTRGEARCVRGAFSERN
jgi:hypothetical protein